MKCQNCGCETAPIARFCQNFGNNLSFNNEVKLKEEVNLEYLKNIFENLEYKTEKVDEENNSITFTHKDKNSLIVGLRKTSQISLIIFHTFFSLKKPGWGEKSDFLRAINKANESTVVYRCYTTNKMDCFCISSHILITEQISTRDIISFSEFFANNMFMVIDNSGIKEFA